MDNITHSLVGILTAESALEVLRIRQPNTVLTRKTRIAFWLSALLANNFCDLDFIPTLFLEPKRLQYLLHHRGHTHTLLLAPLQALIILLGFWGWGQWKKISWEKHEKVGVSFLTLLGVVLHLFLEPPYAPAGGRSRPRPAERACGGLADRAADGARSPRARRPETVHCPNWWSKS